MKMSKLYNENQILVLSCIAANSRPRKEKAMTMRETISYWCILIVSILISPCDVTAQTSIPRSEPPRPDMRRADWQTLNGPWEFEFDDGDRGLAERWFTDNKRFARTIVVPYGFQSKLSGIADMGFHDVAWYRRTIQIPDGWRSRRIMLHFGAVDYQATVWVNGDHAGSHQGGHVSFSLDITDQLKPGPNIIVLRAYDPSTDRSLPRGKQYWKPRSEGIWYTRTTGIWNQPG
ncbi:MAG: hypothetical protein DMG05_28320 [Acidobacteria bacterium]|nr:MAG: hypothetical protein DMG05_28320 [Acidobacteriota bacterium]